MPRHMKPYYRAYPADFLNGTSGLTAEQHGVYRTLLDLMYDRWEPIPWESLTGREFLRHRRNLAAKCGTSVQGLNRAIEHLLLLEKLHKNDTKTLTNDRFERERRRVSGKNIEENAQEKSGQKSAILSENNGLQPGLTRARDSRVHIPDSVQVPGTGSDLSQDAHQVIESEISQICRAIGVTLTSSTHRHAWPARWVEMRDKDRLTVGDMVAAIETYGGQFRGETVKSLGLYRARAIEKRIARELNARIVSSTASTKQIDASTVTREQWTDRLNRFLDTGAWSPEYGPSPLQPGCLVPASMLDNAERYWIEQGNHHRTMHGSGGKEPWRKGNRLANIPEPAPFAPRSK